jgi:hypothetical protein
MIFGLGDVIDAFVTTQIKIFMMETKARDKNISNEERGKLVLEIRKLNDTRRVPLKNALNKMIDKEFYEEIKLK